MSVPVAIAYGFATPKVWDCTSLVSTYYSSRSFMFRLFRGVPTIRINLALPLVGPVSVVLDFLFFVTSVSPIEPRGFNLSASPLLITLYTPLCSASSSYYVSSFLPSFATNV